MLSLSQGEYDKLADSMNNCKGVAEDTAKTMLDNFGGQLTILKSSLEGVAIQFGEVLLPYFKNFVKAFHFTEKKKRRLMPFFPFCIEFILLNCFLRLIFVFKLAESEFIENFSAGVSVVAGKAYRP